MLKNFISLFLCLIVTGNLPLLASPKQTKEEKLKSQVTTLGIGKKIGVTLKSGEAIDGSITEVKDTAFTLQTLKEGKTANREISYTDVNKLAEKTILKVGKMPGRVSIGLVIGIVVAAAVATTAYIKNDRGIR
jgi:hypothetical protein